MEKSFIETWQESSKSLAGLFQQVSDKNVALTQELCSNLASKQWSKMTQAAIDVTADFCAAGDNKFVFPKVAFPLRTPADSELRSFKEFIEISQAAFEKICDSQFSLSQSYVDLVTAYAENLKKSRDIDDVVATNFDYLSNLMMLVKNGTLDSLEVADSIKTALVAWTENSLQDATDVPPPSIRGQEPVAKVTAKVKEPVAEIPSKVQVPAVEVPATVGETAAGQFLVDTDTTVVK